MSSSLIRALATGGALFVAGSTLKPVEVQDPNDSRGSVVTLWANDEATSTFSFTKGGYGGRIEDGELILDDAQIAFHLFDRDRLSFGFVDDVRMILMDLGAIYVPSVPRAKDEAPKPALNLFHTLTVDGGNLIYRGPIHNTYVLRDMQRLFGPFPGEGIRHLVPEIGHTYVLRYRPRGEGEGSEHLAKFQIIDFQTGRSLTFRWALIY